MNNFKNCISAMLILSYFFSNEAAAQVYQIKSFEGFDVKITLSYSPFSKTLAISHLKDTVFLNDYTGTISIRGLNSKFLQIEYNVVGGSGLELRRTLVLSIIKDRIWIPIHLNSYASANSVDSVKMFRFDLSLFQSRKGNYELAVLIKSKMKSRSRPQANYDRGERDTLKFNSQFNVFYSGLKDLDGVFVVDGPKPHERMQRELKGLIPSINLNGDAYYFVNNQWYEVGGSHLFTSSYRNL